MNKVHLPISLRKKWTKTPLAVAGLAVLVAAASAGVVIAQTRESRLSSARLTDNRRPAGTMTGHVERAVAQSGQSDNSAQPASLSAGDVGSQGQIMSAGMDDWAGPVTANERQQVPRKLSSEERNQLRQEIRSASEEVYQPYRGKKR